VHWAGSLLEFLALALGMVPWAFLKLGDRIRKRSRQDE
jgi:hypothetical protein